MILTCYRHDTAMYQVAYIEGNMLNAQSGSIEQHSIAAELTN